MSALFDSLANRRAIIDRRSLADRLREADRAAAAALLKDSLAAGRAEIARRLLDEPYAGTESAAATAFLTDQILRLAHDFVVERLHPRAKPGEPERLLLLALCGAISPRP